MDEKQRQDFAKRISKEADPSKNQELIPAATVVLLRDGAQGMETLMLRKNSKIAFAGMWVFPGGRIDVEDDDSRLLRFNSGFAEIDGYSGELLRLEQFQRERF